MEGGTIVNLLRTPLGFLEILRFREEREPAAEGRLIARVVQPQKVGRAVAFGIARHQLRSEHHHRSWATCGIVTSTVVRAGHTPARSFACQTPAVRVNCSTTVAV